MRPLFIQLGPFALPSYGVALAVGYLVAVLLTGRVARRHGIPLHRTLDLAFWLLAGGVLGSRLLYVVTNPGQFYDACAGHGAGPARGAGQLLWDCSRPLHIWEGGLVFYGALLGALAVALWYTRRHQLSFLKVADLALPGLALGHFFGRLGCWAAGCCYGKAASGITGVRFPPGSVAFEELGLAGLLEAGSSVTGPLHPTQLYEALAELLIFFALLWVRHRQRYTGQTALTYLLLYPLARMALELFRGDPDRGYLVQLQTPTLNAALGLPLDAASLLSTSQAISLAVAACALAGLLRLRRSRC